METEAYIAQDPKTRQLQERLEALALGKTLGNPLPQGAHDHELKKQISDHDHVKNKTLWGVIDKDPTLKAAQTWGVYRETLYAYCKALGYNEVKRLIDLVAQIPDIQNKAAYLCRTLQNAG